MSEAVEQWIETMSDPWINDWNDVLREKIFADNILKELMRIPSNTNIIQFIDRYFIKAGYTNKTLTNEDVRIVYGVVDPVPIGQGVTQNRLSFDIYVKTEHLHNVGKDRLVMRTQLIAKRLIFLLTNQRYNGVYRFYDVVEGDMGTSAIGYSRYNVTLSFTKTY